MAQGRLRRRAEQSRAARGWLDWSQDDLAKRANVSLSTVCDFEKGRRLPIKNNLDAMRLAFEAEGVRLLHAEGGSPVGLEVAPNKAPAEVAHGGEGADPKPGRSRQPG